MANTDTSSFDPFSGPELEAVIPLTDAQKEIWVSSVIDKNASLCYNLSFSVNLKGRIELELLVDSVIIMINRHESLRAAVSQEGDFLNIYRDIISRIPVIDAPEYGSNDWHKTVSVKTDIEFDLANGPLIRTTFFRHSPEEHTLLITIHHIICDGWSMDVLLHDLARIYNSGLKKSNNSLKKPFQFSEYVEQLSKKNSLKKDSLEYWKRIFLEKVPVLDLPSDYPRPEMRTYNASRLTWKLDRDLLGDIKKLASSTQTSFFTVFITAWASQICGITGLDEIVIGVPFAGQPEAGMDDMVGHCVSLLPALIKINRERSFEEQVRITRSVILDAYEHQYTTFGNIIQNIQVKREPSRIPLISICFTHTQKYDETEISFGDCIIDYHQPPRIAETFEIHIEAVESSNGVEILCQYNTSLFSKDTIKQNLSELEDILRRTAADPGCTMHSLCHSSIITVKQPLKQYNNQRNYDLSKPLHRLFELQVNKTPNSVALKFRDNVLTYSKLNELANRLAHKLIEYDVKKDKLVAVYMERSIEMIVALYAILKAGCAYLPLNPELPEERISFLCDDAKPLIILTQSSLATALRNSSIPVVAVDQGFESIKKFPSNNPDVDVTHESLAYCIYTSGSTGMPKGVLIEHKSICNRLLWMQEYFNIGTNDNILQKTPFDFDVSVWEFFWPLINGASLIIAEPGGHRDSAYIAKTVVNERISVIHFVPSMLDIFLRDPEAKQCSTLRYVICSGEALPYYLQERFFSLINCELFNLYGPTETTVDVTYWKCSPDYNKKTVPIGYPVANTSIYILDDTLKPVKTGETGNLYIGGIQVARGYLNRDELTAQRFIKNPFNGIDGERLYHTGDLARSLPDGVIDYLGRSDNQIKLHGMRIEPGEIEYAIAQYPGILQSIVTNHGIDEKSQLIAYYILKSGAQCDSLKLRDFLKEKISHALIPSVFMELKSFQLTPSGKIDRKTLPPPGVTDAGITRAESSAELSRIEQVVMSSWKEKLKVANIGINDNFFDLGGHSLLLTLINHDLRQRLGIDISMIVMFQYPTIASLAAFLAKDKPNDFATDAMADRRKKQLEALQRIKSSNARS